MRISNASRFRTDDIRLLVSRCLEHRGVPSTGLSVEISVGRPGARFGIWTQDEENAAAAREGRTPRKVEEAYRVTGWAILGRWYDRPDGKVLRYGKRMRIVLEHPRGDAREASPVLLGEIARTVDHEVAHLAGLDHKNMSEALYRCTQPTPWADGLVLRLADEPAAEDRAKERVAASLAKEDHARAMLKQALTRLRRATTIAKRWERRVAAYERLRGPR